MAVKKFVDLPARSQSKTDLLQWQSETKNSRKDLPRDRLRLRHDVTNASNERLEMLLKTRRARLKMPRTTVIGMPVDQADLLPTETAVEATPDAAIPSTRVAVVATATANSTK